MCVCTPNKRTPWCGKPGCERPEQKPGPRRFRKKPVVIEAQQWFPGTKIEGLVERDTGDAITEVIGVIQTLEGQMTAMPGDWIITGVKGEKYPCKPEIFRATYEVA